MKNYFWKKRFVHLGSEEPTGTQIKDNRRYQDLSLTKTSLTIGVITNWLFRLWKLIIEEIAI